MSASTASADPMQSSGEPLEADAVYACAPGGPYSGGMRRKMEKLIGKADKLNRHQYVAAWVGFLLIRETQRGEGVWLWLEEQFKLSALGPIGALAALVVIEKKPPPVVSITGGRYVSTTTSPLAVDLESGEYVGDIPPDWIETRLINVRTLYNRCHAKAVQWTQQQAKSGQTRAPLPRA